jgi:rod shape-determining protein MreD
MTVTRAARVQLYVVMGLLVLLQFYLRPRLWDPRFSPDFLFLALMLYAMRSRPGAGAVAGFLVGLTADALGPARFGAAALAHTLVGYLASWGRALFFADNLLVNAAFVAIGLWLRNALVLLFSGAGGSSVATVLLIDSPLQALSTALFGVLLLIAFRGWFAIRFDL